MLATADTRLESLFSWIQSDLGLPADDLRPASSDASFRRYFRVRIGQDSFIAMDAPPPHEDVRPFLDVAAILHKAGVRAPSVHARDVERGFLLLEDFGSTSYLERLNQDTADRLYGDALLTLARLQTDLDIGTLTLPPYDEKLLRNELELFRDWFLQKLLGITLEPGEHAVLDRTWQRLIDSALEQPRVCVHRDYHSRNLMVTEERNPGVLDFQDAVIGPVTYDLVSLLRDCYIAWPMEQVETWALRHLDALKASGALADITPEHFLRWFDWMGIQRHLKAIGIFSRLKLRDGKSGYLGDIPRTLDYVMTVGRRYPEFAEFTDLIDRQVPAERRPAIPTLA